MVIFILFQFLVIAAEPVYASNESQPQMVVVTVRLGGRFWSASRRSCCRCGQRWWCGRVVGMTCGLADAGQLQAALVAEKREEALKLELTLARRAAAVCGGRPRCPTAARPRPRRASAGRGGRIGGDKPPAGQALQVLGPHVVPGGEEQSVCLRMLPEELGKGRHLCARDLD